MAPSTKYTLLNDDQRPSLDSTTRDDEETLLLGGIATTSATRPFATSYHPTIIMRTLALVLSIPSFILFITDSRSAVVVFLSFAIFRQLVVLGKHYGSKVISIKIEVVHPRWKGKSARIQEKWIKKAVGLGIDGVVLIGLLVTLCLEADRVRRSGWRRIVPKHVEAAVILGFLAFGLLVNSVLDFGNPNSITTSVAIERPTDGVVKLSTSVLYGEPDGEEFNNMVENSNGDRHDESAIV